MNTLAWILWLTTITTLCVYAWQTFTEPEDE